MEGVRRRRDINTEGSGVRGGVEGQRVGGVLSGRSALIGGNNSLSNKKKTKRRETQHKKNKKEQNKKKQDKTISR